MILSKILYNWLWKSTKSIIIPIPTLWHQQLDFEVLVLLQNFISNSFFFVLKYLCIYNSMRGAHI